MLSNKFLALSGVFSTLAVATPVDLATRTDGDCDSSAIQCCETLTTASDPVVKPILDLLGIVIEDLNLPVAIVCSPRSGAW